MLAVFGGTFDPVHCGHIKTVAAVRNVLNGVPVLFVPAGRPPHRAAPIADVGHRLAMLRLALAGQDGLSLDERELCRQGPSYTILTLEELKAEPPKPIWPKVIMWAIPLFLVSVVGYLAYNGEIDALKDTLWYWMVANAALAGLGVALARGHPLAILVGALASPITSLNPTLAAGWFAGYTQLKIVAPTGGDAAEFLALRDYDVFYKNRVGRVLLVTALGNLGSALGAWLAGGAIVGLLFG